MFNTAPRPSLLVAASMAALLTACTAPRNYKTPEASLPAAFQRTTNTAPANEAALAVFWQQFQDPVLDGLMQQAWAANLDVRIARVRLTEAQASLAGVEAQALPSFGVGASANRSQSPEWQRPGASAGARTGSVFAASALMNWELDLFGRVQSAADAAAANVSAQDLGIGDAQVALAGAVASNYMNIRGLQQRLAVTQEALRNQREALRLTEIRFAAGRDTRLDVARASSLVASSASIIPLLQQQTERAVQRLATLTNQPGARVQATLLAPQPLPRLPVADLAQWPVGTPADMLRRRPDIRIAERLAAASHAEANIAIADRFPRLSLSGLLGLNSNRLGDLPNSSALTSSLGASLSWTAFDFGTNQANVQSAQARAQRSLLIYEQTVLTALEETENALNGFTRSAQQAAQLEVAAQAAQEAADIARKRYAAGRIDQLALLDAERQVLSAQDLLSQGNAATATALVEVYRALGGGWQVTSSTASR
jgi:outer membrane protein, multidrug efflux system